VPGSDDRGAIMKDKGEKHAEQDKSAARDSNLLATT
jgi:hypothetical protein